MKKNFSVREARAGLAQLLELVAAGEQVVITKRGKPIARIIPETGGRPLDRGRYPLRGSVLSMSKDFDKPMEGPWEALRK